MQKEEFDNNTEADFLEGETTDIGGLESVYPNAEVRVEKAQYSTMHLKRLVEERKELVIDPDSSVTTCGVPNNLQNWSNRFSWVYLFRQFICLR